MNIKSRSASSHTGYIGGYLYNNLPAKKGFSRSQGYDITDPAVRQGIAMAKKDMKKKGFIGLKAKKTPKDLSYLKGYLD